MLLPEPAGMDLRALLAQPAVQRARARVGELEEETLAEQLRIVVIPAPSFAEAERAEHVRHRLVSLGLADAHIDEAGNALARLPSPANEAPAVVVSAHLDTVFADGTDLTPRHAGNRVFAPGITDNARGVAALLTVARVLADSGVRTMRPVWVVGTVGEEGSGDLRGTKHLFRAGGPLARPAAFIALDGSGIRRIVHRAIGARRLRMVIEGPGGHSWSDWGTANPLHALGRVIEAMLRIPLSEQPATTLTVARAGGGSSVNAIPAAAWLELDLRSEAQETIAAAESACRRIAAEAVEAANRERRPGTNALSLRIELIGDRPSGRISEDAPLVAAAAAATRAVGARPELVASSTDSNVPMSLGVPAVTLGAGGESGGIHTAEEWFCGRDAARGVERALLTVLAMAGVA
jgi:acetylornithine deacetylase/succinyl-diaminopimelate desuccinylase-like protein